MRAMTMQKTRAIRGALALVTGVAQGAQGLQPLGRQVAALPQIDRVGLVVPLGLSVPKIHSAQLHARLTLGDHVAQGGNTARDPSHC